MLSLKIILIDWSLILVKIISDKKNWYFLFDNGMTYKMSNYFSTSTDLRNSAIKSENSLY